MLSHLRPALVLLLLFTLLTGLLYPLAVTGIASLVFPEQAAGSLVQRDGRVVGSMLIGQRFVAARYFHGRPSERRPWLRRHFFRRQQSWPDQQGADHPGAGGRGCLF